MVSWETTLDMKLGILLKFIIVSSLLISAAAADDLAGPLFEPGEKLHYKAYVFGWFPIGDAWFDVSKTWYEGKEVYRIDARALGHYIIYTLDIRLQSTIDAGSLRSLYFHRRQVGSEKWEYEVVFDREARRGTYRRKKGDFKTVEEMDVAEWDEPKSFPFEGDLNDILYTAYFARDIGDKVGTSRNYYLVEKDYVWKVLVTIVEEKVLDLGKAGKFDAIRLAVQPDYSKDKETEKDFAGLFGVEGSLILWVDKKTRVPLIVQGRVPFVSVIRPTITVKLQDYTLPELQPR